MSAGVWVVGSINMDVVVSAPRHPRIGETVQGDALGRHPGGKGANQAVAAARLGAAVSLVGALGADPFGDDLAAFLAAQGIDTGGVRRLDGVPTGVALIVVAGGENTIVVVPGANAALGPEDTRMLRPAPGDVVLAQLEIPPETAAAALRRARGAGASTILNAAPVRPHPPGLLGLADVVVVNETELAALAGRPLAPAASMAEIATAARAVRARSGGTVVATLGARGALALIGDRTQALEGRPVRVVDTTGAGDCFVGALAARLAAGDALESALDWANAAASLCVGRPGAGPSMPDPQEVRAALANPEGSAGGGVRP